MNKCIIPIIKKNFNIPNYYYEQDVAYDEYGYNTITTSKKLDTSHKVYTKYIILFVLYIAEFILCFFCISLTYKIVLLH